MSKVRGNVYHTLHTVCCNLVLYIYHKIRVTEIELTSWCNKIMIVFNDRQLKARLSPGKKQGGILGAMLYSTFSLSDLETSWEARNVINTFPNTSFTTTQRGAPWELYRRA